MGISNNEESKATGVCGPAGECQHCGYNTVNTNIKIYVERSVTAGTSLFLR